MTIPGNLAGGELSKELLPGESVIEAIDCFVVERQRSLCLIVFFSIVTLGGYFLYLYFSDCCRYKESYERKASLAVTTKGRVILFQNEGHGYEEPRCCRTQGYRSVTNTTIYKWGDIANLNYMEHNFKRKVSPCEASPGGGGGGLTETNQTYLMGFWARNGTRLTLQFGKFHPDAHQTPVGIARLPAGTVGRKAADAFNVDRNAGPLSYLFGCCGFLFQCCRASRDGAHGLLGAVSTKAGRLDVTLRNVGVVDSTMEMELPTLDPGEVSRVESALLYYRMLALADAGVPADAKMYGQFKLVRDDEAPLLFQNDVHFKTAHRSSTGVPMPGGSMLAVNINEGEVPISRLSGEEVLDVLPVQRVVSVLEWIQSVVTFGAYYLLYLRKELQVSGAMILTNKRLIQVGKMGTVGGQGDFHHTMKR